MSSSGEWSGQTRTTIPAGATAIDSPLPKELGSVQLIEIIGRGASGVVCRGYDHVLGRAVAVKFLKPLEGSGSMYRQKFLDEARAGAAVHHPNLVDIYQAEIAEQTPYLILQYIPGETVAQLLRRHGPLPIALVAAILEETAAAVGELHNRGIIHRDLKPSNILLDFEGHVHVSDLGVSLRRLKGGNPKSGIAGTPAFMAPELFEGRASPRGDVYALGVVLFELLTGKLPFQGNLEELREKHLSEAVPSHLLVECRVPASTIDVIERAMHKRPAFRYKSAQDLSRAFLSALVPTIDLAKARIELAVLLSRQSADGSRIDELREPLIEGSTSTTIAHFAELKRQRRMASEPPSSIPLPALRPSPSAINAYLPCVACGYDLRGLRFDGNCPECGQRVRTSLDPARTIFADPSWLRGVVRGHSLAILSVALLWGCLIPIALVLREPLRTPVLAGSLQVVRYGHGLLYSELTDGAFGMLSLIWLFPLFCGIWLITRRRTTTSSRWRHICRAMIAVTLGAAVFLTMASLFGWSLGGRIDRWPPPANSALLNEPPRAFGLADWLYMAELALPIAVLIYLGGIAQTIPESFWQRRMRRMSMMIFVAAFVLACIDHFHRMIPGPFRLAAIIGYVLYLVTLLRSRKLILGLAAQPIARPAAPEPNKNCVFANDMHLAAVRR